MRNLIATIYFLLSLFGCDGGGTTLVTRVTAGGVDQVYSRTNLKAGIARFECISSVSGSCHYTLFAQDCPAGAREPFFAHGKCVRQPVERFAIAANDRREVVGLPMQFDLCVSPQSAPVASDCKASTSGKRSLP